MSTCLEYQVEDYGATGTSDGSTPTVDASSGIQDALDAATATGGRVTFGAHAYLIASGLTITRAGGFPVWLDGCDRAVDVQVSGNPGTLLLWGGSASNGTMLTVQAFNGGGVRGLRFDCGTGAHPADTGLLVKSSVGAVYDRIDVANAAAYGFVLRGDAAGVYRNSLTNLSTQRSCNGGMLLDSTNYHTYETDVANNNFHRIDLVYSGTNGGLDLTSADANQFVGVTVNCYATDGSSRPLMRLRAEQVSGGNTVQLGARYNTFVGIDGGTSHDGDPVTAASIQCDSSLANLISGLSYGNGIPAPAGSHPEMCFLIGDASGGIRALNAAIGVSGTAQRSLLVNSPGYTGNAAMAVSNSIEVVTGKAYLPNGSTGGLDLTNGVVIYRDSNTGALMLYPSGSSVLGDITANGTLAHKGNNLGFYNVSPALRQLLATGAGHTVDDVISALQTLGLVRQS